MIEDIIIVREDGTYEITLRGRPYHVDKLDPLHADVAALAAAHPDKCRQVVPPPPPALAEVHRAVVARINAAFETAVAGFLGDEPPSASSTYAVQQAEAEASWASPAALTPMLDMLALARGIDKAELVARVLAKAALYAWASGMLLGQQQRLMDSVGVILAEDMPDVDKIAALQGLDIIISLPGAPAPEEG